MFLSIWTYHDLETRPGESNDLLWGKLERAVVRADPFTQSALVRNRNVPRITSQPVIELSIRTLSLVFAGRLGCRLWAFIQLGYI